MVDGEVTERDTSERTRPPPSNLRFERPYDLYAGLPQIREITQLRPQETEDNLGFLLRLRGSKTPEEALTFTAFAARPKLAIWWGYECLRNTPVELSDNEREMMGLVAEWTNHPDDANRHATMKAALFSPERQPPVLLGLAVGWSGGLAAPNDLGLPPQWKCPRMVAAAVLQSLARVSLGERSATMAKFVDLAGTLFRRS